MNNIGRADQQGTRSNLSGYSIPRAPTRFDNRDLTRRVYNSENITIVRNGYRCGYYNPNPRFNDDFFGYPHYVFDPFAFRGGCVVSPWYYYVSLPAYVVSTRVVYINSNYSSRGNWSWCNWDRDNRYSWSNGFDRTDDQYDAIRDLVDTFENSDRQLGADLVPTRGNVSIYTDGRYSYTLNADDFYDLFMDGINNNDTRRYEIMRVETNRRGIRILARHDTTDPWGNRKSVYQRVYMEKERNRYVIREFGTSFDRCDRW